MKSPTPLGLSRCIRWLAWFGVFVGLAACDSTKEAVVEAPRLWSASGKGRFDIEGGPIRLAARRDGIVAKVFVEEGERVVAGQVLAELDSETARRQIALAQAELSGATANRKQAQVETSAARREVSRLEGLAGNDGVARQEIDEANDRFATASSALQASEAAVQAARAKVALVERELEERRIVAPLPGLIAQRSARPGNGVSTLNVTPLFVFVPDVARIARIEVEEHLLPEIRVGQTVEVVLDADNQRRWRGNVSRIGQLVSPRSPSDDPAERQDNRVVEVVVAIDAPDALIGQRVIARFSSEQSLVAKGSGRP